MEKNYNYAVVFSFIYIFLSIFDFMLFADFLLIVMEDLAGRNYISPLDKETRGLLFFIINLPLAMVIYYEHTLNYDKGNISLNDNTIYLSDKKNQFEYKIENLKHVTITHRFNMHYWRTQKYNREIFKMPMHSYIAINNNGKEIEYCFEILSKPQLYLFEEIILKWKDKYENVSLS